MLYVLQMALYCLLFVVLVKCAAGNSGLNCLYFYPKAYIDEAQKRGIADKDAVMKKGTRFMVPFCIVMLAALVAILSLWNRVTDFWTAYVQSYLFLVVMNWFDGIVIDRLWVGHGKIWVIEGDGGRPLREAVEGSPDKAGVGYGIVSGHCPRRGRPCGAGRAYKVLSAEKSNREGRKAAWI